MTTPTTTSLIDELGALIGTTATLRLLAIFGGASLYIPATIPEDHPISRALEPEAARRLAAHYGKSEIEIPDGEDYRRLRRIRCVCSLLRTGAPPREIALITGTTTRQVARDRIEAERLGLLPLIFDGKKTSAPG